MALASISSDDFGGGIYRGRKAPANSVYDLVNGLINDEGIPYKRGGSAYYSNASSSGLLQLWTLYMRAVATNRTLARDATRVTAVDGGTLAQLWVTAISMSRPAGVGDYAIFARGDGPNLTYYAGSLKSNSYNIGTASVTAASATVTGAGTSWLANADGGMLFALGGTGAVVKSVDSNTQITLTGAWTGATAAASGYQLTPSVETTSVLPADGGRSFVVAAGAGNPRLLVTIGNRVYYSPRGDPFTFSLTDYHELPANVNVVGAESRGDSALFFTTGGVWSIGNLSFDDLDAFGNIQHTVEQITKDVILWDDFGIAGWAGGLVLPCIDDVYIAGPDFALAPLTERVRPLYRAYVKAGYQVGQATVHQGHYFLPILNGTAWVDTLVCRLDREAAWSRWSGHAGGNAYTAISEESARTPKLLGINDSRVLDLSGCFDPSASNATDADGTVADCVITTRDFPTGQQPGFFAKARARYELEDDGSGGTDAPTVAIAFTSDADAGTFTTLTDRGEQGGAAGWGVSDGSKYSWATVGKARERGRLRITVSGACARFVLRSIELLIRQSGKQ